MLENCNFNKESGLTKSDYKFLSYLFKIQQDKGLNLFEQKNERYEASFFKQCEEDGNLSSVVVRLTDKINRFKSLIKNPDIDPLDESVEDTLIDLANYATMALVYLDVVRRDNQEKVLL